MTPETLARINDLRQRVVEADAAKRAGDFDRARALEPTTEEIIAALEQTRADRTSGMQARVAKAEAKMEKSRLSTIDLNELFN
jgi:hypothetical protein